MIRVEFIYIKNTDAANDIYVVFDAGTAAATTDDAVKISPNESFYASFQMQQLLEYTQLVTMDQVQRLQLVLFAALLDDVA